MPEIAVVVVTWNSAQFIRDCLASIPEQYHPQTIVIDNNSTDNTAEIIRKEFPKVRLVVNPENAGYAKANNRGIGMIGGEGRGARGELQESGTGDSAFRIPHSALPRYVLLLNPDTKLPSQAIERMLAYLEVNPKVGVLAPKLVNPDGSPQPSCRRFPTYGSMFRELFGLTSAYKMAGFDFNATQEVEQPMASCLLFRREVFEQVGLFDEQFPMFFNDVDLSRRIADAGWTTVYFPEVAVWHYRGGSTNLVRPRMIRVSHQALFRYFRKYDRTGWFWLKSVPLAIIIELAALVRIIAWRFGTKQ